MTQDQDAKAYFTANAGETVTVTLDSVQTNCLTAAALDHDRLKKTTSNPSTYVFTLQNAQGADGDESVFAAVCTFAKSDPPFARYKVGISSDGGGSFTIPDIYKAAPEASFNLFFQIN